MSEQNYSILTVFCIGFTMIAVGAIFLSTVTALTMTPNETYTKLYVDCDGDDNIDQIYTGIVDTQENESSYIADICLGRYVSNNPLLQNNQNVGGGFEFNLEEYQFVTEEEVGDSL